MNVHKSHEIIEMKISKIMKMREYKNYNEDKMYVYDLIDSKWLIIMRLMTDTKVWKVSYNKAKADKLIMIKIVNINDVTDVPKSLIYCRLQNKYIPHYD